MKTKKPKAARPPKTKLVLGVPCKRFFLSDRENPKTERWQGRDEASGVEVSAGYFFWRHYEGSYPSGTGEWVWHVTFNVSSWRSGSPYVATFEEAEAKAWERMRDVATAASVFCLANGRAR